MCIIFKKTFQFPPNQMHDDMYNTRHIKKKTNNSVNHLRIAFLESWNVLFDSSTVLCDIFVERWLFSGLDYFTMCKKI